MFRLTVVAIFRELFFEGFGTYLLTPRSKVLLEKLTGLQVKGKGKGHPCTGTEALYRPYGP